MLVYGGVVGKTNIVKDDLKETCDIVSVKIPDVCGSN